MARKSAWATKYVSENIQLKDANKELKRKIQDLRWECRALRVQLYAHETYAQRYFEKHGDKP